MRLTEQECPMASLLAIQELPTLVLSRSNATSDGRKVVLAPGCWKRIGRAMPLRHRKLVHKQDKCECARSGPIHAANKESWQSGCGTTLTANERCREFSQSHQIPTGIGNFSSRNNGHPRTEAPLPPLFPRLRSATSSFNGLRPISNFLGASQSPVRRGWRSPTETTNRKETMK